MKAFFFYSEPFVSPLFPEKGGAVSISIALSEEPDAAIVRCDDDNGLVSSSAMQRRGFFNGALLYTAEVPVTSSDGIFRFFFAFIDSGRSFYYSKKGIIRSVPPAADRFEIIPSLKAPTWVEGAVCYQIFPDRFRRGDERLGAREGEYEFDGGIVTTPPFDAVPRPFSEARCLDFYNGDIPGIEQSLPYLKDLGVDVLYLNPINTARTVHRYDAVDYFHVDPRLGGDEAYASLLSSAHGSGMRIILDISINHMGTDALWYRKALSDPSSPEHGFFYFEGGKAALWQGTGTLVKLNYGSQELRQRVYRSEQSAMQRFLRPPFMQDGWRLDVAPETGRHGRDQLSKEVWREVRAALKAVRSGIYLVGEDWDDSREHMLGDEWDATMNYYGSSRPLRSWMGERDRFLSSGWGHDPEREEPWSGEEEAAALLDAVLSVPSQTAFLQMNLIDSHDTPRLHTNRAIFSKERYIGCIMALFMLPGMPSIYYGDENLIGGEMGSVEAARYPMDWDESHWDADVRQAYRTMAGVRHMPFFPYSALMIEALDRDAFLIARVASGHAALAIVNRCPRKRMVNIDLFSLPKGRAEAILGEAELAIRGGMLSAVLPPSSSALVMLSDEGGLVPKD